MRRSTKTCLVNLQGLRRGVEHQISLQLRISTSSGSSSDRDWRTSLGLAAYIRPLFLITFWAFCTIVILFIVPIGNQLSNSIKILLNFGTSSNKFLNLLVFGANLMLVGSLFHKGATLFENEFFLVLVRQR